MVCRFQLLKFHSLIAMQLTRVIDFPFCLIQHSAYVYKTRILIFQIHFSYDIKTYFVGLHIPLILPKLFHQLQSRVGVKLMEKTRFNIYYNEDLRVNIIWRNGWIQTKSTNLAFAYSGDVPVAYLIIVNFISTIYRAFRKDMIKKVLRPKWYIWIKRGWQLLQITSGRLQCYWSSKFFKNGLFY